MIQRFQAFVTGITVCYKYIQRIKSAEMTEFGLKGTHMMCLFFLHHQPEGLTAAQLCQLCAEDKAAISRTLATLQKNGYILAGEKKYRRGADHFLPLPGSDFLESERKPRRQIKTNPAQYGCAGLIYRSFPDAGAFRDCTR